MAQKSETIFRKKVVNDIKKIPHTVLFSIQQTAIRGTPDLLLCIQGRFIALELKASPESHRIRLQEFYIDKINNAGGFGFFVDPTSWPEIKEVLGQISRMSHLNKKEKKK